jgi:IS605 OrfB family transposase
LLQALTLKLETSLEDKERLLETMKKYNKACNYVSEIAFEKRIISKYKLHHEVYYKTREKFGLTSEFVIRIIGKVAQSYKTDKSTKHIFRELGAIQYDQRNSKIGIDRVSLMTLNGRIKLRTRIGEYQRLRFKRVRNQSELIYRKSEFYLVVIVDTFESKQYETNETLGVDLGIENIAVDSDKQIFESKKVEEQRNKFFRLRQSLQRCGTKSAKRHLKKLSGKEKRFKRDVNHCISKELVEKAKGTTRAIVLENLKGIGSKVTVYGKKQRHRYASWSFYQFRMFMEYKAKREGVPMIIVNPRDTSQRCPNCLFIHKENRKIQSSFECIRCSYREMADYVAAMNIAEIGAAVNQPIVAETLISSCKLC